MDSQARSNHEAIKEQVASAVYISLLRLTSGGFVLHSNGSGHLHCLSFLSKSTEPWPDQLKEIAYTSVSFPNGTNHPNSDNVNGSPSDVDVRAALTLFNRVKRRHHELQHSRDNKLEEQSCVDNEQQSSKKRKKKKESLSKAVFAFDIISDLGTHRKITCAKSLANLLSIEIEQELTMNVLSQSANTVNYDSDMSQESSSSHGKPASSFFDIRPSNSGIICLVSSHRSKELHAAGRVPCTLCIKWCKGMKGLWWHQLKEHGVDYSNAMEVAVGSVNELAVVRFQDRDDWLNQVGFGDITRSSQNLSGNDLSQEIHDSIDSAEVDPFVMVKNGDLDALVKLIESGFIPSDQLDRNGANILHWAAGCGHVSIVSYLTEKCNFAPDQGQIGKRSFSGRTPLHWAARNGHLTVVHYLIAQCNVDIEAKTLDGTTAFCWAAWQGHLDVMKFLLGSGCDINSLNSFGCNALLWCAQGAATPEILSWLLESGANFSLVNDNGHSALHKAAQRGNEPACKWLVDRFITDVKNELDGLPFIGPDTEGACPSDLCGMNGHESLSNWLSKHECEYVRKVVSHHLETTNNAHGSETKCRMLLDESIIPLWLRQGVNDTILRNAHIDNSSGTSKMVLAFIGTEIDKMLPKFEPNQNDEHLDLNEIDE